MRYSFCCSNRAIQNLCIRITCCTTFFNYVISVHQLSISKYFIYTIVAFLEMMYECTNLTATTSLLKDSADLSDFNGCLKMFPAWCLIHYWHVNLASMRLTCCIMPHEKCLPIFIASTLLYIVRVLFIFLSHFLISWIDLSPCSCVVQNHLEPSPKRTTMQKCAKRW